MAAKAAGCHANDERGAREIHHFFSFGDPFGAGAKAGEKVADIALIPLNGNGQTLAHGPLRGGNQTFLPMDNLNYLRLRPFLF